ncbi:MAG: WbqC family protein, partial [Bacteroidaceae bacterium]|nr:WbqC family protein [Bacteroidaceae bacterium]
KQTYRNRCTIASPQGRLDLIVPIVKPEAGKALMRDIRISDHGNWRHLHWNALTSAYRRSPFFDYYVDDFAPFYERKWEFLADFNEALQALVCQLIDVAPVVERTTQFVAQPQATDDFRTLIHPRLQPTLELRPYYQVFAQQQGFLPGLSIVDLLFNMGPESVLWLLKR